MSIDLQSIMPESKAREIIGRPGLKQRAEHGDMEAFELRECAYAAMRLHQELREHSAPQTVYTVDVLQREDGLYVFANENDAQRFEEAVNGDEDTAYGSSCYRSTQTVVSDAETVAKLIASERDPDDERAAILHGIAWPIRTDGCDPPEGWSWVERDDDYPDTYRFDSDAAEALIAAGIGTEWSYFDRRTYDRISSTDVIGYTGPIGTAVNVPEPDWFA